MFEVCVFKNKISYVIICKIINTNNYILCTKSYYYGSTLIGLYKEKK